MAEVFIPEPGLERIAAVAREAQAELTRQQSAIAGRARSNLAAVRDGGRHRVTTTRGVIDRYVNLEGPAALAVETGHHSRTGTYVAGKHILRDA